MESVELAKLSKLAYTTRMSALAIALVLLSALFHALWNYVAKHAKGGAVFIWLMTLIESVILLPFIIYLVVVDGVQIDGLTLIFLMGSAVLHIAYFLLLLQGYKVGDLSLVYPLARAIGPLIATAFAIVLFQERPTIVALIGGLCICGGAFWLVGDPRKLRERNALAGVRFALYTGLAIASYTLWDSYAVRDLLIAPILLEWGAAFFRMIFLTPTALRNRETLTITWRDDKWRALFVAVFASLAYVLILIALTDSPVSYVAPMRVISTLVGVVMGAQLLQEGQLVRRLSAASVMVIGVIAIGVG